MNDLALDDLTLCKFDEFNGVRCNVWQTTNGEIFVTRTDIGEALEYKRPNDAIRKIHERNFERINRFSRVAQIDLSSGGKQEVNLYNTKGIYEICRWSKQPKANAFMDWVWDLLESVRKNELELVKKQIKEYEPKVVSFNQLMESYNNLSMLQVSKILKISGRNKIFKILRDNNILMSIGERKNLPYQQYIDLGYFSVVIKLKLIGNQVLEFPTTTVTPKGLEYIRKKLNKILDKNKDLLKQAN